MKKIVIFLIGKKVYSWCAIVSMSSIAMYYYDMLSISSAYFNVALFVCIGLIRNTIAVDNTRSKLRRF